VIEPSLTELESMDRLVRSYLDRETAQTDATDLLARIRDDAATSSDEVPSDVVATGLALKRRWPRRLTLSAATMAAVVLAFCFGRYFSPRTASASTLLESVRAVHERDVDRCYRVQFAPDPRYWDRSRKLDGPSESTLWTRGDRFSAECSIGDIRLQVGRDGDGTLWVSPSRSRGIRFADDPARLPKEVATICSINSMTVPTLVDDVLADFELSAEPVSGAPDSPTRLIWAKLKPGRTHWLLSAAMLEIDVRTNVLNRLVLWTLKEGRPNGTVTSTLLEKMPQSDVHYRLESHLDSNAVVEDHTFEKKDGSTTGSAN
jgi:hypothetical protein